MTRPVLGVTCCTRAVGTEPAQAVMNRYVTAAMKFADVAALLVPALPDLMSAAEVAPRLDGLLLTGSPSNVEPARYGEAGAADAAGPYDPARDAMTAGLIAAMIQLGKPVVGVCRGFQEINVALGGTLRRDTAAGSLPHHAPDGADRAAQFAHEHEVELAPGGVLARAFHRDRLRVNSVHYQGIGRLADGLMVEARAPDGLIEAVSARLGDAPVLAVQWHPEWDAASNPDSRAFFALIGKALRGEPL
ncbi:MAG TPA: gamma-glutamyl-gamma-aminobutyrate hydrolase family protein [Caulobacteraceae bacterium]